MKAILYYSSFRNYLDMKEKKYPIFSLIEFNPENLLKIKEELDQEIVITDGTVLPTCVFYGKSIFKLIEEEEGERYLLYLTSFSYRELELLREKPKEFLVLEIYNGYRE